ncbi:MAG: hypothetical protein ABSF15_28075 [Candidatus Sulfotelmatobacter sp.]|jgi:hypothetical protein
MFVKMNPAARLSLLPGLSRLRNARNVSQKPYAPGYVLLSGAAVDDSVIPPHAPRDRVEPLYFQNVVVRKNASVEEMHAAIRQQILC